MYRQSYLGGATLVCVALMLVAMALGAMYGLKALAASQAEPDKVPIVQILARSFRIDLLAIQPATMNVSLSAVQNVTFNETGGVASVRLAAGGVRGNIDQFTASNADSGVLRGWVISADGSYKPTNVLLIDHGKIIARGPVSGARPDVATALGSDQFYYSGFSISIPPFETVGGCRPLVAILLADASIAELAHSKIECESP